MSSWGAGVGWGGTRGQGWRADSSSSRYSAPEQMLGHKVVLEPRRVFVFLYVQQSLKYVCSSYGFVPGHIAVTKQKKSREK